MHNTAVSAGMLNIDQLLTPQDCGDRKQASQELGAFIKHLYIQGKYINWRAQPRGVTGFVYGTLSTLHIYIDHSPSILGLHILSGAYCSAELMICLIMT